MLRILLILAFLVAGTSCLKKSDPKESDANIVSSKIINGDKVDEKLDRHLYKSAVSLELLTGDGPASCSGVLISSNVVLTAAHCMKVVENIKDVWVNIQGESSEYEQIKKFISHPGYLEKSIRNLLGNFVQRDDIALVFLLDKKIHSSPMKILEGKKLIKMDMSAFVAGFSPFSEPTFSNVFENLNSSYFSSRNYSPEGQVLRVKNSAILRDLGADERFVTLMNLTGGSCRGDSGGPAFIKSNGENLLIGVGANAHTCERYVNYTNVQKYKDWIIETIQKEKAELPQFVTLEKIAPQFIDKREFNCRKELNAMEVFYRTLYNPNIKVCYQLKNEDFLSEKLEQMNKACEETCRGAIGVKDSCDYFRRGNDQMKEHFYYSCNNTL